MQIALIVALFLVVETGSAIDTVTITGSTTVMPFVELCAEEFNGMQSDVRVSVGVGGSGVGIKNVALGFSDMGMISREIREDEIEIYGDQFSEFLVAYDGVCIAVSQLVYDSGVTNLSREEVRAIYDGNVTDWTGLGGPDEEIIAVARWSGSGTGDLFNELVMGDLKTEALGVDVKVLSNAEMKTAITEIDRAIGYLGLNYVQDGELRPVAYEGVAPSIESIEDKTYPISRALYLITWGEPDESEQKFLDFAMGEDGQAIAREECFVSIQQVKSE